MQIRSGALAALALVGTGMIVFAQFPAPHARQPAFPGSDIAVGLAATTVPVPPAFETGYDGLLSVVQGSAAASDPLPDPSDPTPADLFMPPTAGLGDFDPVGLLPLPLFPLTVIPLFFTLAGSLFAFLRYEFSPQPATFGDALGDIPAGPDEALAGPTW
jgi:hypothetical protein